MSLIPHTIGTYLFNITYNGSQIVDSPQWVDVVVMGPISPPMTVRRSSIRYHLAHAFSGCGVASKPCRSWSESDVSCLWSV